MTVSFLTLASAKLWFAFKLRAAATRLWDNDVVRNGWLRALAPGLVPLVVGQTILYFRK